ncbi:MAG TPA: FAD-linked oxidase C-terminal domain-containing protein [Ignavibacteria bacterium]|nr:FAD-linked oxidase C-terminal domain-containing protein [Ignavibacteria bacterium]
MNELKNALINICGKDNVYYDEYTLDVFSKDNTEKLTFLPEIVVKPKDKYEISEILKFANEHLVPVTPRGGGTGLSGGALPVNGGIVLSVERMNKILNIDRKNFFVETESGVITQNLQDELENIGLFYPVDPASRGSCFIGGNIAENSGGPRALKYGVTKDYVLGLEFVTAQGEIINTGSKTLKNTTGYNLSQLITGSEGTLGIVTKITLKILSKPKFRKLMLIAFDSVENCIEAVSEIFIEGVQPSVLEFLEKSAVKATENHLGKPFPNSDAEAQLLVEVDGMSEELLYQQLQAVSDVAEKYNPSGMIVAEDNAKMEEIWALRRAVGEAVKSICEYKEEDTVVPRYRMPELLKGVKEICQGYGIRAICYGHAGDGNLHINILRDKLSEDEWINRIPEAVKEIFKLTVSLGGTITGEHGIGYSQKPYLGIALLPQEIELQKNIKKLFDPNNILNPGKIF